VDPPAGAGVAPEVWEGFERSLARLGELGVSVDRFDPGELDAFLECGRMLYGTALVAERFAAVGHAVENLVPGLDPVVFGIISRAGDWTAADAYQAEYELQGFRRAIEGFWERFDVLALPTVPRLITRAEVAAEPLLANERLGRLTTFVNLLDLCAVVAPLRSTGVEEAGPPPSLQLVAPAWSDSIVADIANTFEAGVRVDATDTLASAASHSIVVVGAHLNGQPLHHQLTERRARFVAATTTSPKYRLHALSGTVPPKPGLVRDEKDGATVEVEVWSLDDEAFGTFVRGVPPPLCIGTVELADGSWHKGFLCEPIALPASEDITSFGGWRAYLTSRSG
jgi:allophanate hydrolase